MSTRLSNQSQRSQSTKVHRYVDRQLDRTRRQVKSTELITHLLVATIFVLGFLQLLALADAWVWSFNSVARWLSFFVLVGGAVVYLLLAVGPLLLRKIHPDYAAKMIEDAQPTFKNSLLNYVSLRKRPDTTHAAVMDAVTKQAAIDLQTVPEDATVDRSSIIRIGFWLLGLIAFVALYWLLSPKNPLQSFARVLLPAAKRAAPSIVQVTDVSPGDQSIFFGDPVLISATIKGQFDPQDVKLIYSTADGQVIDQTLPMEPQSASSNRFEATLTTGQGGVQHGLVYKVVARDGASPDYEIVVRPNPSITLKSVEITPPEYTLLPPVTLKGQGAIEAVEGSLIKVNATANLPIKLAYLELLVKRPQGDSEFTVVETVSMAAQGTEAHGEFHAIYNYQAQKQRATHFRLKFLSTGDDANQNANVHALRVIADLAPEIEVLNPIQNSIRLPVNETLLIDVRATDIDYGISSIELEMQNNGSNLFRKQKLPLRSEEGKKRVRGQFQFTPERFFLRVGETVLFTATASDNRTSYLSAALDPNQTITPQYQIEILDAVDNPQRPASSDRKDEKQDSDQQKERGETDSKENADRQNGDPETARDQDGQNENQDQGSEGDRDSDGDRGSEGDQEAEGGAGDQGKDAGESSNTGKGAGEAETETESESGGAQDGSQSGAQTDSGAGDTSDSDPGGGQTDDSAGGSSGAESESSGAQTQGAGSQQQDGSVGDSAQEEANDQQRPNDSAAQAASDGGAESAGTQNGPKNAGTENGEGGEGRRDSGVQDGERQPLSEDAADGDVIARLEEIIKEEKVKDGQGKDGQGSAPQNRSEDQPPAQQQTGRGTDPRQENNRQSEGAGALQEDDFRPPQDAQGANNNAQRGTGDSKSSQGEKNGTAKGASGNQTGDQSNEGASSEDSNTGQSAEAGGNDPSTGAAESSGQNSQGAGDSETGGNEGSGQASTEGAKASDRAGQGSGQQKSGGDSPGETGSQDQSNGPGNQGQPGTSAGDQQSNNAPQKATGENGKSRESEPGENDRSTEDGELPGSASGQSESAAENAGSSDSEGSVEGEDRATDGETGETQSGGSRPADADSSSTNSQSGTAGGSEGGGTPTEIIAEKQSLEHSKKATDLVLKRLEQERFAPDPALLDELNWNKEDLNQFLDRWQQMKAAAQTGDPVAKQRYEKALKSLGLSSDAGQKKVAGVSDKQRGFNTDSAVNRPPQEIAPGYRAFQRARNRSKN